jgi:hypothetical protein
MKGEIMRLGAFVFAACTAMLPIVASAQINNQYTGRNYAPSDTVIRPAPMDGWRNYVTVPDGPCGYPMSVQTDCYTGCGGCCCGPLVFLHRCKMAVLSCLLPCNACCRGCGGGLGLGGGCGGGGCGGCGPAHGCGLSGRNWGHCGVCCGGPVGYGRGPCGGYGGCGGAPAYGGHCCGCGAGGAGGDPIFENSLPAPIPTPTPSASPTPTPTPTSMRVPEVRRRTPSRTQPAHFQLPQASTSGPRSSAVSSTSNSGSQSVLRKASAEESVEPAPLFIDYPTVKPIVRSQSPDTTSIGSVPFNPLRK